MLFRFPRDLGWSPELKAEPHIHGKQAGHSDHVLSCLQLQIEDLSHLNSRKRCGGPCRDLGDGHRLRPPICSCQGSNMCEFISLRMRSPRGDIVIIATCPGVNVHPPTTRTVKEQTIGRPERRTPKAFSTKLRSIVNVAVLQALDDGPIPETFCRPGSFRLARLNEAQARIELAAATRDYHICRSDLVRKRLVQDKVYKCRGGETVLASTMP